MVYSMFNASAAPNCHNRFGQLEDFNVLGVLIPN